ncbi:MAG: iron-containing alcohol dehydrogenase [bacterium]|nr:iron-containing alcohol dehydrogenase [bacterium]MCP4133015.1 iron-containing alcohol dehydrogenase [bacterium]
MDLPKYYEFCCRVKTISGHKTLEKIPEVLVQLKSKKPMIIADKGVVGAGLIKIVTTAIGKKVKIGAIFDDVPPDSDVSTVNAVAATYKSKGCDAIIAVGGGSVLDTAKGVNILVSENAKDLMRFTGFGALKRPLKPMIAIPTTSGTGSEVTSVAVIADHSKNLKMLFPSLFLLPDVAVLDPRMTKTLPPFLTSTTAMDALTHAVEAYTCLSKNPLSDITALNGIELIAKNVINVVKKPGDLNGRLALANGSLLAGMAFSNSTVGMVHTMGHSAGAVCHVPHGVCMSILLPYGLEYNLHKNGHLTAELLFALAGPDVYAATPKKDRPLKTIEFIRNLNQELFDATKGAHARFLGEVKDRDGKPMIPKDKLPDIARTCLGDASLFYNPEDLNYDDYLMVLEHAWEGTPLDRKKIKKGKSTSKIKVK